MNMTNDLWFRVESPIRIIGRIAMMVLLLGFALPVRAALVSTVDPSFVAPAGGDGDSAAPVLSADGRFVALNSPDGRLVSADHNRFLDVFVRDTVSGGTELVSARDPSFTAREANGWSWTPSSAVSDDGRWIALTSFADNLVPNDVNGSGDVFVHDLQTSANVLVSAGADSGPAWGGSSASPAISGNGRYVAFVSSATNLVAGRSNFFNNIFLRDLQAETTVLVSVSTNGVDAGDADSSAPLVSRDGRRVVYLSNAHNLAPDLSDIRPYLFWRDLDSGQTLTVGNMIYAQKEASMSADGRFVAFLGGLGWPKVWDSQANTNIFYFPAQDTPGISPSGRILAYPFYLPPYSIVLVNLTSHSNIMSIPLRSQPPCPNEFSRPACGATTTGTLWRSRART